MPARHLTRRRSPRPHRHTWHRPAAMAAAAAVALGACGSGSEEDQHTELPSGDTALSASLDRIAAFGEAGQYIEYGATGRIDELSGGSFEGIWGSLTGWGSSSVFQYREQLPDVLGIDLRSAESVLSVGRPPHTITLIEGGQDADDIVSASTESGWTGDDVLSLELEPSQPLSVSAPHVMPAGSDVAVGAIAADLSVVDSDQDSLGDAPQVDGLAACLDDVVAALFHLVGSELAAVGVRVQDGTDTPVSVVCVPTDTTENGERLADAISQAVAAGESVSGQPYSDLFTEPTAQVLSSEQNDQFVRLDMPHTGDAFANSIFQLAIARELPGLSVDTVTE